MSQDPAPTGTPPSGMPPTGTPPSGMSPSGMSWARAADALASRVRRRMRRGVAFTRVGLALLVAAALALLWRAAAPPRPGLDGTAVVLTVLALGVALGALLALRARRRQEPIGSGDAAWALDRLAAAGGRGLAAAAVHGPAASEAAFADGGIPPPPAVRLHPPRGLALVVGALLLAVLAVLAPGRTVAEESADRSAGSGTRVAGEGREGGAAAAASRGEKTAATLQAQADAARGVRTALSLPPDGPLDPKEVATALMDPGARKKAADAAGTGSDLSALLNATDTSGDAVARLLERGEDNQDEASRTRREAAGARARLGVPAVPPARRDVVQQYLSLIDRERAR